VFQVVLLVAPENEDEGIRYLYAISFLMSATSGILIPVIPVYAFHLGATQFVLGLIGSAPAAMYALFTFMLGGSWDRLGKKIPIIAFYVMYTSICLLYSFTTLPFQIIMLKTIEGLSWALFWPPLEALIAERTAGSNKAVSNFGISWSSGAALGVFLSGFALELNRPKDVFRLVSLSSLTLTLTSIALIKERRVEKVEIRKKANPITKAKIFSEHREAWLSAALYAFGQNVIFALFPAYAEIKSMSGLMIGLYISTLIAGRTLAFWSFGKIPMEKISLVGAALMSVGSLPIAITTSFPILVVGSFSIGFGAGLLYSSAFQKVMTAKAERRGLYAGIFEGSIGIGYLSPVVAGALAERSLNAPYVLTSAGAACMFLWFILVHPSKKS